MINSYCYRYNYHNKKDTCKYHGKCPHNKGKYGYKKYKYTCYDKHPYHKGEYNHNKCKNFFFDVVGDLVYHSGVEEEATQKLIDNVINKECPLFVVHVGDFQGSPISFANPNPVPIALNENQWKLKRDFWFQIKVPFIVTPGDNDWMDTIMDPVGSPIGNSPFPPNGNPIVSLNAFRKVWYKQGTNVKFPFKVISQPNEFPQFSDYIENKRWYWNGVVFVTIHTVAGNNGLSPASAPSEVREAIISEALGPNGRIAANEAWLNKAFDIAEKKYVRGLVIMTQADPHILQDRLIEGFKSELRIIRDRSVSNIKKNLQVLLIHGDTHVFTVNKKFPLLGKYPPYPYNISDQAQTFVPNLTVIQISGSGPDPPGSGASRVKIEVDLNSFGLFKIYHSLTTK